MNRDGGVPPTTVVRQAAGEEDGTNLQMAQFISTGDADRPSLVKLICMY